MLAALGDLVRGVAATVGINPRAVFFQQVNKALTFLRQTLDPIISRVQAVAAVQFLRQEQSAAAAFQAELEEGGPPATIPTSDTIEPGEFRATASVELDLPYDRFSGTVYFSYRGLGIPTAEQLNEAFAAQLLAFAEDYEIDDITRYLTSPLQILTVEGGA